MRHEEDRVPVVRTLDAATAFPDLAGDEAIAAPDTLLLTIPNQLGVDYNAHLLDSLVRYVAPQLGWR